MSKLAAFAGGVGEGYFAAKRYKDNKKRMETQDNLLREVLTGNSMEEDPGYDMDDETADATGLPRQKPRKMANGGMVMPHHADKMSWQRQSFKKSGK